MADLFAGLSVNPSVSPTKQTESSDAGTAPPPSATASATAPGTPPATPSVTPSNGAANAEESPPPANESAATAPEIPPLPAAPPPAERITSAPTTDKLLGLLGGSDPPAPASPTRAAPSSKDSTPAAKSPKPAEKPPASDTKEANAPNAPTTPQRKEKSNAAEEVLTAFSMESATKEAPKSPSRKQSPKKIKPSLRGVGTVTSPIPHADVALRLFRKFASKTRPLVPSTHGGSQRQGLIRYFFGPTPEQDRQFDAYRELMELIVDGNDAYEEEDADRQVDAVMGQSGDTMAKAKNAVARFCHLLNVWGHASAHMAEAEQKTSSSYQTFCDILAHGLDTATALATHGCLDDVTIRNEDNETRMSVDILSESVFSSDLSQERIELSAMKFLLSTGCRVTTSNGQAMLRGSHLLQTIRVLYHVFLTTTSNANKTTARASLQQLVTSVFIRMIASSTGETQSSAGDGFPTENHRDAFLVLRSLCKLSMRSPPSHLHSHVGLQAGNSNTTWDAKDNSRAILAGHGDETRTPSTHESLALVYTQAIHPALESKILALDLVLYVLQNTDMKGDFLHHCGSQFHYAIRNYLCVSLLKNCTSDNTHVVNLSLRVFVPIIHNFRSLLKSEIEAFVTNVFFVILDSKNSPMDHKNLVVTLFEEICSDPQTLAEIFLNYDCDLSAVDLFHRIVNTLAKVARSMEMEDRESTSSTISLVAGTGAARMEKIRNDHRELRLEAMRALRQVLASLHGSIVKPMQAPPSLEEEIAEAVREDEEPKEVAAPTTEPEKQSLVQIYDSKKKRREEESEAILRFNQKPSAGIAYAGKCGHLDPSDPDDVARYLLANKDKVEKTQIGDYLGREPEYQEGFAAKVLHGYANQMEFAGVVFDNAIRHYLSGFRLPGEAQKIDRIMEKFAERFTAQNPDVFPTADAAFILAFSIIMLNTDLHNPAIKEERKMTKDGFVRLNAGICDGQDLPRDMLTEIFDRILVNPISLKEDDEARERAGESETGLPAALSPAAFFTSPYEELDRTKESNFHKERDQIVRTTESLLRRRRHAGSEHKPHRRSRSSGTSQRHQHVKYVRTADSGLRDEYVSPMFEVTWGPALAAFSTAMESANGTVGALLSIATDDELEAAATNAAETIEVCLTGFRFAICTAGLCGNDVARDAYMLALTRFSQLGTGILLEPRHVRCIQTILALARSDGELLGISWEHVFKSLSEINRFHQLFQLMARNNRVIAHAAERRKSRLQERDRKLKEKAERRAAKEASETLDDQSIASVDGLSETDLSYGDSDLFSDSEDFDYHEDMDKKEIDEANARSVYEAVSEGLIEAIYERSSSLSTGAVKEFVLQLCRVSRMEISNYGGQVGSDANHVDLTQVHYRQHHTLLANSSADAEGFHHHQPNIYNLQKLVEVTHYNMESRPRLVFADIWITVAAHLTSTALHANPAVAMYAVDSFRQLSIQYLQREELEVFEFQRRFLKPLETVMSRSEVHTTKELLLKCIERLILMFGAPTVDGNKGGKLRSGWGPILTVLGLAGRDPGEEVAQLGFNMLTAQIEPVLSTDENGTDEEQALPGPLLAERFVDLVDAFQIYVNGPHEELSLNCLDHLLKLSGYLADESFALPLIKKRSNTTSDEENTEAGGEEGVANAELELWWPILLGTSRAIGSSRKKVREKSLEVLSKIITTHFFPSATDDDEAADAKRDRQVQLLQLIFRGILTPVLEFAEYEEVDSPAPHLPDDFDRFLSVSKQGENQPTHKTHPYWLDTTFDQFMDVCVRICLSSMDTFGEDTLVEEIFAMLNSCLLSDSGALAVRGLRRLEQFVTSDLKTSVITDDTWATVSHMLRRTLAVRGLPRPPPANNSNGSAGSSKPEDGAGEQETNPALEEKEAVREFVMEDSMNADRRFVASNAVFVMESFLGTERFNKTLGLRWRLFLVSGLGRAIREWEAAAAILQVEGKKRAHPHRAPHYLETVFYGRKYMNRFLLQLASLKEVSETAEEGSRQATAQSLIKDQTQSLVGAFLEKEAVVTQEERRTSTEIRLFERLEGLVKDMLAGYDKLPDEHLAHMSWLNPVLSSCIHTENESIRLAIQKLVQRLHE